MSRHPDYSEIARRLRNGEPQAGWYLHQNGGGLIADSAVVDPTALVEEDAVIGARSELAENVVVKGASRVGEDSTIGARTVVERGAWIGSKVRIAQDVHVEFSAFVDNWAVVARGAVLKKRTPQSSTRFYEDLQKAQDAAVASLAATLVFVPPSPYVPLLPRPDSATGRVLHRILRRLHGTALDRLPSLTGLAAQRICPGDPMSDDMMIPHGGCTTAAGIGTFNYLDCDRWTFWPIRENGRLQHDRGSAGCVASPTEFLVIDGFLYAHRHWVAFGPKFRSVGFGSIADRLSKSIDFIPVTEDIAARSFLQVAPELPPRLAHLANSIRVTRK